MEDALAALRAYFDAAGINSNDYVLRVEGPAKIRLCARDKAVDATSALEAFRKSHGMREATPCTPMHTALAKVPGFESATDAAFAVLRCVRSVKRDPDVLDTWFSSQLWPFSTLGWPDQNPDLEYYYPGSVLITSRDIITLWVARMVMSGLYFVGDIPFHHTYIHTKILDGRGESMSKSKGNGVDPLDIVDVYGADALRYTLAEIATELQDVRLPVDYRCPHCHGLTPQTAVVPAHKRPSDVTRAQCQPCGKPFATQWASDELKRELQVALETSDRFETGRNLCNKLWNAARFAFMHLEGTTCEPIDVTAATPEDRWILAELSRVAKRANELMARYQFSPTIKLLREFFWDSLCDWYVELTKPRLASEAQADRRGSEARQVLAFCLDQTLRLFHPFIPFVTERLWQQLNAIVPQRGLPGVAEPGMSELVATAPYPPEAGWPALDDPAIVAAFEDVQSATRGVRELRNRCKIVPKRKVDVTVKATRDHLDALQSHAHIVREMAGIGDLRLDPDAPRPPNAATTVIGGLRIMVHDISDDQAERKRIETECASVDKQIAAKQAKLANEKFVTHAKPEIVEAERQRLAALEAQRRSLQQALGELS